jgi:hypothetical protein
MYIKIFSYIYYIIQSYSQIGTAWCVGVIAFVDMFNINFNMLHS